MKVIGITGGVGAGKSSILKYINKNYRTDIIYADDLAAQLEKNGEPCFAPLVELLGEDIIGEDREIDRKLMASKVFNNDPLLEKVNDIVHPAVKEYIVNYINKLREEDNLDIFFIEAALLIECGYKEIVDEMWYVYADLSVRRERLKASRGYSDQKINSILDNQLTDEQFRENSDFVIDNSFDPEYTYKQIDKKLSYIKRIGEE